MTLIEAFEADLRGLIEELENQDVFAPGEAEAWYDAIDEAEVVSDYMTVNEAIVDVLDDREGVDTALQQTIEHQTKAFY